MDYITIVQWAVPALTIAAAYGGTRQALNGTREKVKSIDTKMDHLTDTQQKHGERLAVVETKVDALK